MCLDTSPIAYCLNKEQFLSLSHSFIRNECSFRLRSFVRNERSYRLQDTTSETSVFRVPILKFLAVLGNGTFDLLITGARVYSLLFSL